MTFRNHKSEIINPKSYFLIIFLLMIFPFNSAHALSISPVRQTVVVDPGEQMTVSLEAKNDTGKNITVVPSVASFAIDEETGLAVFGDRDSAIAWVTPMAREVRLRPGEKKNVSFVIAVPASAEPLSHYLALFVGEAPPTGSEIGIGSRVGSLLYLHVGGEQRESLVVEYFSPPQRWIRRLPVRLDLQIKNAGTIHAVPSGDVRVIGNGELLASFPMNEERRTILPGGRWIGTYDVPALTWWQIGKLRASVYIQYGLTNQVLQKEITFWYVPWWTVGVGVSVLAGALCGIAWWRKRKMNIKKLKGN